MMRRHRLAAFTIGLACCGWLGALATTPAEAQISFRAAASAGVPASATITTGGATSAGAASGVLTLTINKPTGTAQGDVMIASIAVRPNPTITAPAGWTLVRLMANTAATANSLAVYWKVAGASEPASYSWTFSSSTGSAGGIQRFAGVDTANPIDVENGQSTPSSLSHATPSVTTTVANTMLVTSYSISNADTWTPPTGMTEAFDRLGGSEAVEGNYVLQAAAGPTGVKTATSTPGPADQGNAHILALRPVGASLTINKPTGTASNDVMIASIAVRPNTVTITAPSGWTLVRRMDNANPTANSLAVYWKVAGASEPASYTWVPSAGHTGAAGGIQAFSGVDTATPIDVENGDCTLQGSCATVTSSHATPSVTTTVANTMLVTSHGVSNADTWTPPTGMTEAFDVLGGSESVEGNYVLQAAAGPTGAKSATSATTDVGNAHILALRPVVSCGVVGEATYVTATAQSGQVTVYWNTNPAKPVVVLEKTTGLVTETLTNGTTYAAGQTVGGATVRYVGSGTSFTRTGLADGTYDYKVFVNDATCYSSGGAVSAEPATGTSAPSWGYTTSASSLAAPALDPWSNVVLSGSNDNRLHGTADADGTRKFDPFPTGGPIQARPAMVPAGFRTPATTVNVAYVTSQDGYVYAVNTTTGAQVWQSPQLAPANMLQGGTNVWAQAFKGLAICGVTSIDAVFVGTRDTGGTGLTNKVYALNGSDSTTVATTAGGNCPGGSVAPGGILWTFNPGTLAIVSSVPWVDTTNDTVWVTSRSSAGTQPSVWKLSAANGTLLASWNNAALSESDTSASAGSDSAPIPGTNGTYMYVGTNAGNVKAIRVSDGAVWSHTPASGTGAVKGAPWPLWYDAAGTGGETIIFTRAATVHSVNFNGSTFTANWTTTLTGSPTVSAPVDDGANRVYVGASDGKVHQLSVVTGADQAQATVFAGIDKGFNFRATTGYATDGAGETYVLGTDMYPTTRNGVTFGWLDAVSGYDANNTLDRRLAGVNYVLNNAGKKRFRVDLPATGSYSISLALGVAGTAITSNTVELRDDTTVLITISGNTAASEFLDASGVNRTAANWPGQNVAIQATFATTTFIAAIGRDDGAASYSTLAHLRIAKSAAGVGDPTFNVDTGRIHVGASNGRIYTFGTPF